MCIPHRFTTASVLMVVALIIGTAPAADFSIVMARAVKVGDRYGISGTGQSQQVVAMTMNGQQMPEKRDGMEASLTADAQVLEITPKGREKRTSLTLTKSTRTLQGMTADLLPVGTVVLAERVGPKTQFTVDGKPVAPDVAKALDLFITMGSDESASDDTIFGTSERKQVGDSWPVNTKAAVADFAEKGKMKLNEESFSGKTTLVEVVKTAVGDGLRLAATIEFSDVTMDLPPGMTIDKSRFSAQMTGIFPLDTTKRALTKSMGMEGQVIMGGKAQDRVLHMTMTFKQVADLTYTLP